MRSSKYWLEKSDQETKENGRRGAFLTDPCVHPPLPGPMSQLCNSLWHKFHGAIAVAFSTV